MSGTKPFEIGLVMAGAVSAGAYTAGVVDFLIEALDRWEASRREDEQRGGAISVPHHDVMITTMTGASAGAMTTAMTAAALFAEHQPVASPSTSAAAPPPPPTPRRNRLYDCWVEQIDIAKLLGTTDLAAYGEVVSLLDSSILTAIAQSALDVDRLVGPPRRYIADPLALFLTVSNLRGVPYAFSLFGEQERRYGMNAHLDNLRFAVSADLGPEKPALGFDGMQGLDPIALFEAGHSGRPLWDRLVTAALASGAFPIGLEPRVIERPGSDYRPQPYSLIQSKPGWSEEPWIYRFVAVDGGLMSNEPMSLARAYAASGVDPRLEQSGHRASGALVLVDPFPNEMGYHREYWPRKSLVGVFSQMFSALKSQARFNAEDLERAADPDVYNRFAISPSRVDADGRAGDPAIASAIMGGFGGFLSRSFRQHDFLLGRRNCQAFLAYHFALPETNPVFSEDNFPPALRDAYYLRERNGQRSEASVPKASGRGSEKRPLLPIIPLLPPLDKELALPAWPHADDVDAGDLRRGVAHRVEEAGALMIDTELKPMLGTATAWVAKRAWRNVLAQRVTDAVMTAIDRELRRLG